MSTIKIDLSKMDIKTDENLVDENGKPLKEILIFEEYLYCHPSMEEKLKEALDLFFKKKEE